MSKLPAGIKTNSMLTPLAQVDRLDGRRRSGASPAAQAGLHSCPWCDGCRGGCRRTPRKHWPQGGGDSLLQVISTAAIDRSASEVRRPSASVPALIPEFVHDAPASASFRQGRISGSRELSHLIFQSRGLFRCGLQLIAGLRDGGQLALDIVKRRRQISDRLLQAVAFFWVAASSPWPCQAGC